MSRDEAYFIADETLVKVELRLLPTPCMAAMAATAISAAIRPYSMAVAPLLLLISLRMNCIFRSPRYLSTTENDGLLRRLSRSEERRIGTEGRSRWSTNHYKSRAERMTPAVPRIIFGDGYS